MSTIKTGTTLTTAYQVEGDTTGALVIQTGSTPTTAVTVAADQNVTVAGNVTLNNGAADGAQLTLSSSGYSDWNWDNYSGRLRAYYGSTEYFTINSSGNVGIGVTPSAWSASAKAFQLGAYSALYQNSSGYPEVSFNAYQNASNIYTYQVSSNPATRFSQTNGAFQWFTAPSGTAGAAITFTQAMTLNASGNLGIGTSSPSQKLAVVGNQAITGSVFHGSATNNSVLDLYSSNGGSFYVGIESSTAGGSFTGSSAYASLLVSNTAPLQFGTSNIIRATIDSSGNLLVGTTSAGGTGGWTFYPTGSGSSPYVIINKTNTASTRAFDFLVSGTSAGSINWTNTATSYLTSSDYRLKENIAPMTGALSVVSQLKPCTYKWKIDGSDGQGFIAHELQAVVPDAVSGEKDAVDAEGKPVYQGIDTSFLVATLTAAIQEQQALITSLTARIEALESK